MRQVKSKSVIVILVDDDVIPSDFNEVKTDGSAKPILTDGSLVLGQEQDSVGGFFDPNQAFSGELSQVEFWSSKLDPSTITSLAKCEQNTAFATSRVVSWNEMLDEWSLTNVAKRNQQLSSLCKPQILQDYLIWAEPVTYPQIFEYCQRLDGTLPEVNENTSLEKVHATVLERFVTTEPDDPFEECAAGDNLVTFWLNNSNVTMYADLSDEQCQYAFGNTMEVQPCTVKFPCGICKLPEGKRLIVKGMCEKDVEDSYDFDFGIYGTKDGKALFRGSQNSIIRYHKDTKKWRLQSLRNPLYWIQTVGELDEQLPIGKL